MADRITPEQRHLCMSHIKGRDTKPEILVRKALFRRGFRYRVNVKGLAGHPDIVLPKHRTVVFVNGCFWHGHVDCKRAKLPDTNAEFWREKIEKNIQRDLASKEALEQEGWRVLIVWECELSKMRFEETINALVEHILSDSRQ